MNDTIREWIPAYHDGELPAVMREQVETHLETCAACRADLAELRTLSHLLQEAPVVAEEEAAVFARRVVRRLPGRRDRFTARVLRFGLRAMPLGLFAAWAFCQAIAVLSQGLLLTLGLVPGAGQYVTTLIPQAAAPSADLGALGMDLLGGLVGVSPIQASWLDSAGSFIVVSLLIGMVFVVLFMGWLAGWWAYQRSLRMQ